MSFGGLVAEVEFVVPDFPVRGFNRGQRLFWLLFGWLFLLVGLIGLASLASAPASGWALLGLVVAYLVVVGLGSLVVRAARTRFWVEVNADGVVTVSHPAFSERVELCATCVLDTESWIGRYSPRIKCKQRTWPLRPLQDAPWFMGGEGPDVAPVLEAIQRSIDSKANVSK